MCTYLYMHSSYHWCMSIEHLYTYLTCDGPLRGMITRAVSSTHYKYCCVVPYHKGHCSSHWHSCGYDLYKLSEFGCRHTSNIGYHYLTYTCSVTCTCMIITYVRTCHGTDCVLRMNSDLYSIPLPPSPPPPPPSIPSLVLTGMLALV